jgi:glutamate synthase domain-containing protein 1
MKNFLKFLLVGYGKSIEIFKQVGNPKDVVKKFNLESFSGTHGIGHTRMATESAITTDGSHPYSTGEDECLVHNGSLSNHNNLRRELKKKVIFLILKMILKLLQDMFLIVYQIINL